MTAHVSRREHLEITRRRQSTVSLLRNRDRRSRLLFVEMPNEPSPSSNRAAAGGYHPFLLAGFAVLSLYAANFQKVPATHIVLPLICVLGAAGAAVLLLRPVFGSFQRASLAASYLLILTFSYSHVYSWAQRFVTYDIPRRYSLLTYFVAVAVGFLVILRWKFEEERVTRAVNRLSTLFVLASLITIAASIGQFGVGTNSLALDTWPSDEPIALQRAETQRDIYYLVFDRYANNETLIEHFEFDNSAFLNALEERGFHCANESRANYPKTVISMSAALNMSYHDDQLRDEYYYSDLLRNHRVGRLLKDLGYRYYHYGNWYYPLRSNINADYNYRISRLPSEFADVLYKQTPVGHTDTADLTRTWGDPKIPKQKFEAVAKLAEENSDTKFVYAHFLVPHPPFVLDRDGTPLSRQVLKSRTKNENYVNQLIYTNRRILELVDVIQASSAVPPIIILQSDEGPELYEVDKSKGWEEKSRKRTGILSAFYLPKVDTPTKVPATITPVNTFRVVFNEYFGAELPMLDDRSYFWRHRSPFVPPQQTCIDVTADVHGQGSTDRSVTQR